LRRDLQTEFDEIAETDAEKTDAEKTGAEKTDAELDARLAALRREDRTVVVVDEFGLPSVPKTPLRHNGGDTRERTHVAEQRAHTSPAPKHSASRKRKRVHFSDESSDEDGYRHSSSRGTPRRDRDVFKMIESKLSKLVKDKTSWDGRASTIDTYVSDLRYSVRDILDVPDALTSFLEGWVTKRHNFIRDPEVQKRAAIFFADDKHRAPSTLEELSRYLVEVALAGPESRESIIEEFRTFIPEGRVEYIQSVESTMRGRLIKSMLAAHKQPTATEILKITAVATDSTKDLVRKWFSKEVVALWHSDLTVTEPDINNLWVIAKTLEARSDRGFEIFRKTVPTNTPAHVFAVHPERVPLLPQPPDLKGLEHRLLERVGEKFEEFKTHLKPSPQDSMLVQQQRTDTSHPRRLGLKSCHNWADKGRCWRGDGCRFSHEGPPGNNQGPERCFDFQKGRCKRGSTCRFQHGSNFEHGSNFDRDKVCFDFQRGNCARTLCRFSHVSESGRGKSPARDSPSYRSTRSRERRRSKSRERSPQRSAPPAEKVPHEKAEKSTTPPKVTFKSPTFEEFYKATGSYETALKCWKLKNP
jgi:hypothetical protein